MYPCVFMNSKYCQTVFQNNCPYLLHSVQSEGCSTFSTSLAKRHIAFLFVLTIWVGVVLSHCALVSMFLMITIVGPLFICLLVFFWIRPLVKWIQQCECLSVCFHRVVYLPYWFVVVSYVFLIYLSEIFGHFFLFSILQLLILYCVTW